MIKINNNLKENNIEHLNLSNQLLNLTLEGEKYVDKLKMRLDNHIKSVQILLHDNEKYLICINELEKSTQDKKSKAYKVQNTLESFTSSNSNVISNLKKYICILKDEKAHFEYLLDDCEA